MFELKCTNQPKVWFLDPPVFWRKKKKREQEKENNLEKQGGT